MQKAIITSSLIAKRAWYDEQDPLSFVKQAVEAHPFWEVEDTKTGQYHNTTIITEIVLKNTKGVLNYDPRVIFKLYSNRIFMGVAKSYDSSKEWYDQEGALNNGGNYTRFGLPSTSLWGIGFSQVSHIVLNDYSIIISQPESGSWEYYLGVAYIKFEIFNSLNKDSSGMYIEYAVYQNSSTYFYIYSDNIWYGKNWSNIYTREGKVDIDKPVGTYHKTTKKSSFNAINKSFFINAVENKTLQPLWQYVGKSYLYYAYTGIQSVDVYLAGQAITVSVDKALGNYVTAYTPQGRKRYYITGFDYQVIDADIVEVPTYIEQIL